jgi:hypothetical protein
MEADDEANRFRLEMRIYDLAQYIDEEKRLSYSLRIC